MHISLITSLYRSERFLPTYSERLLKVGQQVGAAGLDLEVIIIANDATERERQLIIDLASRASGFMIKPFFVPRETLYASWNRAVQMSSGTAIAMWNVDDDRESAAFVEGYKRLSEGCEIVDFPYTLIQVEIQNDQLIEKKRTNFHAFPYNDEKRHPLDRTRTGPFFMYQRSLYDRIGGFDERFKVCGDFDWTARASPVARMCSGTSQGGTYFLHGKNLSMSSLLAVEENMVILRHGDQQGWYGLQYVPPTLMRDTWRNWEARRLPPNIQRRLWGRIGVMHYRFSLLYRIRNRVVRTFNDNPFSRTTISKAITKSGLRPFLAKIGLLKSSIDSVHGVYQVVPDTEAMTEGPKIVKNYAEVGPIPWSAGYPKYKMQFIHNALLDNALLDIFRQSKTLPTGYGQRLDERVIEFPWVYAHLSQAATRLLDAGSTLNHLPVLSKPRLAEKNLVIYTLSPEAVYGSPRVSYVYGDLRETILRDNWFDDITCISTLEHIGMDNTMLYTADETYAQTEQADFMKVMSELARLLKPGGHLWLTVPYGKSQNMGWQQQFDRQRLQSAIDAFRGQVTHQAFYQYTVAGWQISTADACDACEYFDIHTQKHFDPDCAAAARAVACLGLTKPM